MKKKILVIVMMTLYIILSIFTITPAENSTASGWPEITGQGVCVIDARTGAVIYGKGMNEVLYPASITKIMTALLTIEYVEKNGGNYDEQVTFPQEAVFGLEPDAVRLGLVAGEVLTIREALYAVMLKSANEVCIGLGIHISGSHEAFAEKMTARAKELGCNNTQFRNSNGLHDKEHYTTAYDMALIMREAVKYGMFVELISTPSHDIPPTNKFEEKRPISNSNQLIQKNSQFYYEKAVGSKTGFTDQAQHTLVTYVKDGGAEMICAILYGAKSTPFTDTAALCDYASRDYQNTVLLEKTKTVTEVPVYQTVNREEQVVGSIGAVPKEDISAFVPASAVNTKTVVSQTEIYDKILAPVKKGDVIGTVRLLSGDVEIGRTELLAANDVAWAAQSAQGSADNTDKTPESSEAVPASVSVDIPQLDTEASVIKIAFWEVDARLVRNALTAAGIVLVLLLILIFMKVRADNARRMTAYHRSRKRRQKTRYTTGRRF